jgi:4a-hydroxytetrahydrobiopterin dehydratase
MNALSKTEVTEFLKDKLKDWSFDGKSITRDFKFKTFVEAFSFMTAIALEAEKLDHHPEWSNVYNSVSIHLNTHDAKGITKLDFELAKKIDQAFKNYAK